MKISFFYVKFLSTLNIYNIFKKYVGTTKLDLLRTIGMWNRKTDFYFLDVKKQNIFFTTLHINSTYSNISNYNLYQTNLIYNLFQCENIGIYQSIKLLLFVV